MKFLRRLFGCPRYDWVVIAPYAEAGMQVLFEDLHDGWEPVMKWNEAGNPVILLRREI